jgi:hypothetical protein
MPNLLRDTVQGVLSAAGHVLWYVDWQMSGARAARPAPRRAGA